MTSPAPVGFPDWQRTFSAARNVLVNVVNKAIVAPDVNGPIATVNMRSILIDFQTSINHAELLIEWFIDKAATVTLTQDVIVVRANIFYEQTITVKGPFARFTVTGGPAGACTYFLRVSETASDSVSQVDSFDSIIFNTGETSIAATSTLVVTPLRVLAAPASWFAFSLDATSWEAILSTIDHNNSTSDFAYASNKTTPLPQGIYLPSMPVTLTLFNHDAQARTFFATVTEKPLYP